MNTTYIKSARILLASVLFGLTVISGSAQQLRTAYFMENSPARTALNPAFRPERGYVSIPVLGAVNASYTTNGIAVDNILFPKNGKTVTFMDNSVNTESFLNNLKDNNQINAEFGTQILSGGWYAGKGFWTVDVSLKGLANVRVPKTMFEFMKRGNTAEGTAYDIRDISAYAESYLETGVGYSRPITEKLTVGGKVKLLLGVGSMDANITHLHAVMNDTKWSVTSTGTMSASMKGLVPEMETDEQGREYISSFDFDSPGLSGFGMGVDLGATYQLTENIILSAAVLDLGFVSWNKSGNTFGEVNGTFDFYGFDLAIGDHVAEGSQGMGEQFDAMKNDFENLFHFTQKASEGRTSRLRSTINVGGEYRMLENKLGFGLLSSTRLYSPKAYTELTVSANYRPIIWFEAALSYSFIHSKFKTYGLALNFTPSWINFFIGSDYMFTKVTPQFIPVSGNATNLYMGISVPLRGKM